MCGRHGARKINTAKQKTTELMHMHEHQCVNRCTTELEVRVCVGTKRQNDIKVLHHWYAKIGPRTCPRSSKREGTSQGHLHSNVVWVRTHDGPPRFPPGLDPLWAHMLQSSHLFLIFLLLFCTTCIRGAETGEPTAGKHLAKPKPQEDVGKP